MLQDFTSEDLLVSWPIYLKQPLGICLNSVVVAIAKVLWSVVTEVHFYFPLFRSDLTLLLLSTVVHLFHCRRGKCRVTAAAAVVAPPPRLDHELIRSTGPCPKCPSKTACRCADANKAAVVTTITQTTTTAAAAAARQARGRGNQWLGKPLVTARAMAVRRAGLPLVSLWKLPSVGSSFRLVTVESVIERLRWSSAYAGCCCRTSNIVCCLYVVHKPFRGCNWIDGREVESLGVLI